MKKIIALVLTLSLVASVFFAVTMTAGAESTTQLYVAKDGNDANNGSISAPFASLTAARDAARKIDGKVIINIREGKYTVTSKLELSAEDSNTTYRAYKDEDVVLSAANVLNPSDFEEISEEKKAVIIDQKAAANVKMIDLKALGITEYGSIKCIGFNANRDSGRTPVLYVNDEMQTIARYPNADYVETGDVQDTGTINSDNGWTATVDATTKTRMKKWTDAKDLWVFGYFMHDWAESNLPVKEFSPVHGTITTGYNGHYGVTSERRYYFYNLLEELDAPGEWYLDRDKGVLYLYPKADMNKVEFVTFDDPIILAMGAKNITLKNIKFEKGLDCAVNVKGSDNVVLDGCEVSGFAGYGISITGSKNSGVKNCHIYNMGSIAIYMDCGDRKTLSPSNCFITNNHIEDFAKTKTTDPGCYVMGVGIEITNNEMHDSPHTAIRYQGNEIVIEYNEFYKLCKDTSDSGAVYTGRDWTTRGCKVNYNYFHDMKMIDTKTGMKMQAVYLDDMHSSTQVNGNVFYKVSSIALFGGGRYNEFTNNLLLESDDAFVFDARGTTWMQCDEGSPIMNNLLAMPYKEGVWAEKYPELGKILEDDYKLPKYNTIKNNVIYKTPDMDLNEYVTTYGTVENNIEISDTKAFANYGKDFSLVADGEILKKIPDFEIVDYSKIGRKEVTEKDTDFEEAGGTASEIKLVIGSDKLVNNGEEVKLDVPAQIINERTMIPLRAIFEALGATVAWDDATKTVTAVKGDITIKMTIGADSFTRNGESVALDSPATIVDSRTLVPVRAIAESFGSTVGWDGATKTVTISK